MPVQLVKEFSNPSLKLVVAEFTHCIIGVRDIATMRSIAINNLMFFILNTLPLLRIKLSHVVLRLE